MVTMPDLKDPGRWTEIAWWVVEPQKPPPRKRETYEVDP